MRKIPTDLQGVFWSKKITNLDLSLNKEYVIHQVLMYGSLEQINWLKSVYTDEEIRKVFLENPKKLYTPQTFNLIKNYILKIKADLPAPKYVKTVY